MKQYFIEYWSNFGNTYTLYWAETPDQLAMAKALDLERITRKEAIRLCGAERRRRANNPAFAFYASTVIYPIDFPHPNMDAVYSCRDVHIEGYIVEYNRRSNEK